MLAMSVLFLADTALAQTTVDCFSCHDRATFQKKVKHEPVESGDCFSCHNPHVARHAGLLQELVPQLCYSCHGEMVKGLQQAVVHRPVREGKCLSCHDPHASDQANLLNARPAETCLSCHTTLPKQFKFTHAPYAKGECASCHNAHQSSNPALLVKEADKLCLTCHSAQTVQQKHPGYPAELKNCGTCHNPHGSDNRGLIRNVRHEPYTTGCKDCHAGKGVPVGIDICLGCHDDVGTKMASSHNHLVRYGQNGCTACHSPHAGDDKRLLKGRERYVCSTCHLDTFQRYDAAKSKHVTTDACTDCHAAHGSNYPNMLSGPINSVCATCHEKHSQFTHPIGEKVFDPRTLQSLTCTTCHRSKGSEHFSHLRFDGNRDLCVQCHRDI
jgi:predicted CXXCH cytochrome family protein